MRVALLTVVALLALPGAADATVVPQRGMIGVQLGDSLSKVRAVKGAPDRSRVVRNEILGRQRLYRYGRTWVAFNGARSTSTVISLTTTSRRERLANGIGVGSTRSAVRRKVRRAKCKVEYGVDHCYIGEFRPGRRVTDFRMGKRGRVRSITVGFVID